MVYTTGARFASPGIIKPALTALSAHLSQDDAPETVSLTWRRLLELTDPRRNAAAVSEQAMSTLASLLEAGVPLPSPGTPGMRDARRAIFVAAHNASINTRSAARVLASVSLYTSLAALGHRPSLERLVQGCARRGSQRIGRAESGAGLFTVLSEVACFDPDDEDDEETGFDVRGLGVTAEQADEVCELIGEVDWVGNDREKIEQVVAQVKTVLAMA